MSDSNDIKNKTIGGTITPQGFVGEATIVNETRTQEITLKSESIKELSHNKDNKRKDAVLSAFAIHNKVEGFFDTVNEIYKLAETFSQPHVISDPLVNPHFGDAHWYFYNAWEDNGRVQITKQSDTSPYAYLQIFPTAFTLPVFHYCEIEIETLTPGTVIEVTTNTNKLIHTISTEGLHKFKYKVDNADIASLYFKVVELPDDGTVIFTSCYFHHVKSSVDKYTTFMVESLGEDTGGLVTHAILADALKENLKQAREYANSIKDTLENDLKRHIEEPNPHGTQPHHIGASPEGHTHTPDEVGAAAKEHKHNYDDLVISEGVDFTDILDHLKDTENPHSVDKEQVGLGNLPNSVSHLPTVNDEQSLSSAKATYIAYQKLLEMEVLLTNMEESVGRAILHMENFNNPHGITKDTIGLGNIPNILSDRYEVEEEEPAVASSKSVYDLYGEVSVIKAKLDEFGEDLLEGIGLDNVENFPMATPQEHIEATLERRYANPKHTKEALEAWIDSGVDVQKLQPKVLHHLEIDEELVNIPLLNNKKYRFYFTSDTSGVNNIELKFNGVDEYFNTHSYNSVTTGEVITEVTEGDSMRVTPKNFGANFGSCCIEVDTRTLELSSTFIGRTMDEEGKFNPTSKPTPTKTSSSVKVATLQDFNALLPNIEYLTIINPSEDSLIQLSVYEYVPLHTHPAVVVDAHPVGWFATSPHGVLANGYSFIDGSELDRDLNPDLWRYAVKNELVIPEVDWLDMDELGEDILDYSDGDGMNTFRIPKLQDLSDPFRPNMIKIKPVAIPEDAQMLFYLINLEGEEDEEE